MSIKKTHVRAEIEHPKTGEVHDVVLRLDNRDMVRYDLLRERKQWPQGHLAPMLWLTIQAWSALTREQSELAGNSADNFLERCFLINRVNEDGTDIKPGDENVEGDAVNPTQPTAESDY